SNMPTSGSAGGSTSRATGSRTIRRPRVTRPSGLAAPRGNDGSSRSPLSNANPPPGGVSPTYRVPRAASVRVGGGLRCLPTRCYDQLVPQREVLEHEGALGPDTTEEAGEIRVIMPAIIDQAGRPFNVDEADGISRRHRYHGTPARSRFSGPRILHTTRSGLRSSAAARVSLGVTRPCRHRV